MRLLRLILRCAIGTAALLSGCRSSPAEVIAPPYGIDPPRGDSTVEIIDFSYEPASPVPPGSDISFSVTLNKSIERYWSGASLRALIGDAGRPVPGYTGCVIYIELWDNGSHYDTVAGDNIFSGGLEWQADYGVAESLPVIAKLDWYDDTPDVIFTGEPLTVVEGEQ